MKTVKFDVKWEKKASPREAVIRLLYAIVLSIIMGVLKSIASIMAVVQWFHIIVTGERHKGINEIVVMYLKYEVQAMSYILMATDEQPPALPE